MGLHPTQEPVPLLKYLIKTYTNEGATVLDPFMGSGSTGVACMNTGRNFIGFELDDGYFDIAKKRIEEAKSNKLVTSSPENRAVYGFSVLKRKLWIICRKLFVKD